jgi:hypothetical protein
MKLWSIDVFHCFREKYLNAFLNEFAFRWDLRHNYHLAFERPIGIALYPAAVHGCPHWAIFCRS